MLQLPAGSRLPPKNTGANDDQIFDDSYLEDLKLLENNNQQKDITAEQFVEEQVGLERTYSKTDLQQSCSQELAKELDLINGGFYEFQEKAFRIIGQHLIAIVGDTTTTEEEKQKKITELYEHDELYWILGQYGLKHVALIKLIEKLKHHSYGLTREQIKDLEKRGLPKHILQVKSFLEDQLKKMPPTTRQEKQDLIFKVVQVASIYNMGVEEKKWITKAEIEALVESMNEIMYSVATVEEDRKQILKSANQNIDREDAIDHFSTNYVSNMLKNDKVMTYSAKVDDFLQMFMLLKSDLDSFSRIERALSFEDAIARPTKIKEFIKVYKYLTKKLSLKDSEELSYTIEDLLYQHAVATIPVNILSKSQQTSSWAKYLMDIKSNYHDIKSNLLETALSEVLEQEEVDALIRMIPKQRINDFVGNRARVHDLQYLLEALGEKDLRTKRVDFVLVHKFTLDRFQDFVGEVGGLKKFITFLIGLDISSYINFVDYSEAKNRDEVRLEVESDRNEEGISYQDDFDKADFLRDVLNTVDGHEAAIFFNDFYMRRRDTSGKAKPNGTQVGRFIFVCAGGNNAAKLAQKLIKYGDDHKLRELFYFTQNYTEKVDDIKSMRQAYARHYDDFYGSMRLNKRDVREFYKSFTLRNLKIQALEVNMPKGSTVPGMRRDAYTIIERSDIEEQEKKTLLDKLVGDVWYEMINKEHYIILDVLPHPWAVTDFPVEKFASVYGNKYRIMNLPERFFPFPAHEEFNKKVGLELPSVWDYKNLMKWIHIYRGGKDNRTKMDVLMKLCNLRPVPFDAYAVEQRFNGAHEIDIWAKDKYMFILYDAAGYPDPAQVKAKNDDTQCLIRSYYVADEDKSMQ